MFKANDTILYAYLLVAQEYFIDNSPKLDELTYGYYVSKQSIPWYENKSIITDENIFDINNLNTLMNNPDIGK
jgi:hypothetical protein